MRLPQSSRRGPRPRTKPRNHSTNSEARWFWLLVSPALVGFLAFNLGPMVRSLYLSFTKYDVVSPPQFIGLRNYTYLMTRDPAFWPSVKVTAIYAAFSVPLGLLSSLLVALLLNRKVVGRGVFRTIFFLPSLLPAVASGMVWVFIFHPSFGLLNRMLKIVGIEGPAWTQSVDWALPALIIMGLWSFGQAMVIFLAGLQDVPASLYEAADLDGASSWSQFRHVTLPMITPVLFFNLVMGLIAALKVFDSAYVFGSAGGAGPGGPARATLFYAHNHNQKAIG
ncbi:MAG: sugar ABC transporter permease [Anaerolineae bacterium]|nr:sugar ABC transporter permease [Phycisphaerae bacterium]